MWQNTKKAMRHKKAKIKTRAFAVSCGISLAILLAGFLSTDGMAIRDVASRLLWPLLRLMFFITVGLAFGQIIELAGWTTKLAVLARPLFRFGKLGPQCSAAFTTAFFSGISANAMLLEFYESGTITKKQLFLSNFINQMPAYFLHLPTTFFIVIPLTHWAGALYFLLTFLAMVFRTILFLIYGHLRIRESPGDAWEENTDRPQKKKPAGLFTAIKERLPARVINVAVYVLPIYVLVYVINKMGVFDLLKDWMAHYVATQIMPMESLSVIILSFAAEFTSGFAAAGALMAAGALTIKQTVLALLIGNVLAFPVRTLRHQLPRYIGIFSPKMGTQMLLMGQSFRISSLILAGIAYYMVS